MNESGMESPVAWALGPVQITSTVLTTWVLMLILVAIASLITRKLSFEPGIVQTALEGIVGAMESAIEAAAPGHGQALLPFVGSLWVFVLTANLVGLLPGLHSPTGDLSTTAGLALLVFVSVHWYGVRTHGIRRYLRHYLSPSPILLPFHIISEITRTLALALRLFGNIMSLELAALLVLLVAGFLVPIPVLMLHIVEALVQAYIFGMLALIYIAGGMQLQETRTPGNQNPEGEP